MKRSCLLAALILATAVAAVPVSADGGESLREQNLGYLLDQLGVEELPDAQATVLTPDGEATVPLADAVDGLLDRLDAYGLSLEAITEGAQPDAAGMGAFPLVGNIGIAIEIGIGLGPVPTTCAASVNQNPLATNTLNSGGNPVFTQTQDGYVTSDATTINDIQGIAYTLFNLPAGGPVGSESVSYDDTTIAAGPNYDVYCLAGTICFNGSCIWYFTNLITTSLGVITDGPAADTLASL